MTSTDARAYRPINHLCDVTFAVTPAAISKLSRWSAFSSRRGRPRRRVFGAIAQLDDGHPSSTAFRMFVSSTLEAWRRNATYPPSASIGNELRFHESRATRPSQIPAVRLSDPSRVHLDWRSVNQPSAGLACPPPLATGTSLHGVFAAAGVRHRSVKRVASTVGRAPSPSNSRTTTPASICELHVAFQASSRRTTPRKPARYPGACSTHLHCSRHNT
jgi:hypothetical protein